MTGLRSVVLAENLIPLVAVSALTEDEGVCVEVEGREAVAVFLHGGQVHVVDDQCSHGPASLSEGMCVDDEIECPFHLGRFCLKTGEATHSPCYEPIRVHKSRVVDGVIYLVDGMPET